jgi:YVTN family beta-propeller protein
VLNKRWLFPLPVLLLMTASVFLRPTEPAAAALAAAPPAGQPDRSPSGLVLLESGRFALTTNRTSDTVSLVDLENGKLVAETPVGKQPFAVAAAPGGRRAVVTNWLGDTVSLLDLPAGAAAPRVAATIAVGDEPRGVVISPSGARAFVALGGENAVAVVDLKTRALAGKWPVGREPWHLALSPDGKTLAVANTRGASVTVLDTQTGRPRHTVKTNGLNLRSVVLSPDAKWAYVPFISDRGFPVTNQNIDRGWVVGNRLGRVPLSQDGPREAISLDPQG